MTTCAADSRVSAAMTSALGRVAHPLAQRGAPTSPPALRVAGDDQSPESPVVGTPGGATYSRTTAAALAALARVHDRTRLALASTAERTGSRREEP